MNRHTVLATATSLAVLSAVFTGPAAAQTADTVACYKTKDRAKHRTPMVSVASAASVQTCTVTVPARLACVVGDGRGGAFLCYPVHCPGPLPPSASMTDALGGQRVVSFKGARLLCDAATSQPVSSTTTTVSGSTTTTVPTGPCEFDDGSRTCTGTCGGGAHCSAVASGGACECRTTACGDASSPSCDGYCARDESCVFLLTGCRCVAIP